MSQTKTSPFADGLGPALLYFAYRSAAWLAEQVPISVGDAVARAGAKVSHAISKSRREVVRKNLARVVGDGPGLDDVVEAAFRSYADYWAETFRASRYSNEDLFRMVECATHDVLDAAFEKGRGVVIVTAHFGFYDLAVSYLGAKGYPIVAVAEVLKPRALFEWFAETRGRRGMSVIPARPSKDARRRLFEEMAKGHGVALVADRDLGRRGRWVELFGERTTVPAFPPMLVAETGAPLLTGAIRRQGGRFLLEFRELEVDESDLNADGADAIAEVIASGIEQIVTTAPEQWHLFTTNWPSDEPHLPPRGRQNE